MLCSITYVENTCNTSFIHAALKTFSSIDLHIYMIFYIIVYINRKGRIEKAKGIVWLTCIVFKVIRTESYSALTLSSPFVFFSLPLHFQKFESTRKTGEVRRKINFAVHPVRPWLQSQGREPARNEATKMHAFS